MHRVIDQLTPGQRWTSGLAIVFAASLLAFGTPLRIVERSSAAPDAAGPDLARTVSGVPGGEPTVAAPRFERFADATMGAPPPSPTIASRESSLPAQTAKLVALVHTGGAGVPGRDDAAIANTFLADSGLDVTTIDLDAGPPSCDAVAGAGDVFMAGGSLPAELRSCLVAAGKSVVAFDAAGDVVPQAGGGQVVSTRRGVADTLLDAAAWAGRTGALRGKAGVVADRSLGPLLEQLLPRFRDLGVEVSSTVLLDDSAPAEITTGVRSFASAGITSVLLAAPMDLQRQWVAQAAVLLPQARYVVADTFDAVVDEAYPASFDQALAYTSVRVPWFAREHGETAEQTRCRTAWEDGAGAAATLGVEELLAVFSWCQTVELVAGAVATAGPASISEALRTQRLASPLTADLGPLEGGGYGPTAGAELVWRSGCQCWTERTPFLPR